MSRLLEMGDRTDFKKYVSGELDYKGVDNWGRMKTEERESLLVAIASLNVE
jgi:hypothetical protein